MNRTVSHADLTYRPEIDGLRAFAVIPVVLFHAHVAGFSGGYVGVDVFFVISGFLITSLIVKEYDAGTFSYLGFLERRARRLVPAAVPVVLLTWLAGFFLLLPKAFEDLSSSVYSLFLLIANHFFLSKAGYFAESETAPLLHTWSLSVEEQFYLVFSLVLLVLLRHARRHLPLAVALCLLASLAVAEYLIRNGSQDAAFFLAVSRFWELLVGVFLAVFRPGTPGAYPAALLRISGIALIVSAIVVYGPATVFPGFAALLPTLGAAFVILAGSSAPREPVYRLLSSAPAVYVGKISYSLYLWHWPLLVYAGLFSPILPNWYVWPVIALSCALAVLSYHLVETPIRRRRLIGSRTALLGGTVALGVVCVSAGAIVEVNDGLPQRLPERVRNAMSSTSTFVDGPFRECLEEDSDRNRDECIIGDRSRARFDFALWGDSHAFAAFRAYEELATERGLKGIILTHSGCGPMLGVNRADIAGSRCAEFGETALRFIRDKDIDTVFLQARWRAYAEHGLVDLVDGYAPPSPAFLKLLPEGDTESRENFRTAIAATLERLVADGRTVHIVDPVPVYETDIATSVAFNLLLGLPHENFTVPRARFLDEFHYVFSVFDVLEELGIGRIRLADSFCPGEVCLFMGEDSVIFYFDKDHLNDAGARFLEPALEPAFETMSAAMADKKNVTDAGIRR